MPKTTFTRALAALLPHPTKRARISRRLTAVIAVAIAFAVAPLAHAADAELRGQWHLDTGHTQDDATNFTPDSSGNGLDAVVRNATEVDGRFDKAFHYTEASLTQTSSTLLRPAQLTTLAWVRRIGTPGPYRYVVAQGSGSACTSSAYALYTSSEGIASEGGMDFYVTSGSTAYHAPSVAAAQVWDGNWHMVAGTFDGTTARFYLDGLEVGSGTSVPGAINYSQTETNFRIGRYGSAFTEPCAEVTSFNGDVDEVRVYGRALNRSELRRMALAPGPDPPALEPDADDDFVPDARDNCPTVPNTDQHDGDGDGAGGACEGPPVANFVYAPVPVCIGAPTTFNATNAIAGANGPIVNYRWTYLELEPRLVPASAFGGFVIKYFWEERVISDGPSATPVYRFPWNRPAGLPYQDEPGVFVIPPAERDPVSVTLTITDSAGGTASVNQWIDFARFSTAQPPGNCPPTGAEIYVAPIPSSISVGSSGKVLAVKTTCNSVTDCPGALIATLFSGSSKTAARRRKRLTVLARAPYLIPAGERATIRAPLNRKARGLLRRRGRLRVKVSLMSVTPDGENRTRSRVVTLKRKKRR
jgi:Concanavalin A-like lectin/glucanases superfamily